MSMHHVNPNSPQTKRTIELMSEYGKGQPFTIFSEFSLSEHQESKRMANNPAVREQLTKLIKSSKQLQALVREAKERTNNKQCGIETQGKILKSMSEDTPQGCGAIGEKAGVSRGSVAYHIQILMEQGKVLCFVKGRLKTYIKRGWA